MTCDFCQLILRKLSKSPAHRSDSEDLFAFSFPQWYNPRTWRYSDVHAELYAPHFERNWRYQ